MRYGNVKDKKTLAVLAVAVAAAVAGMAAWIIEGVTPESDMGLASSAPWGSSMALFITFIGLATGSSLVGACSVLLNLPGLRRVCGLSCAAGLAASIGGVFYIMSDLGNFPNIMSMLTGFNVRSLLSWDMIALPLFMVADAVFLLALRFGRALRGPAAFVIAASLFLLFVDAWIFEFNTSREAWASSVMLPWFIVSAVSSGLALTMILAALCGQRPETDAWALGAMAALAGLDAFFAVTEVALGFYHGAGAELTISQALVFGNMAELFWFEVAASIAAIILALTARRSCLRNDGEGRGRNTTIAAGALIVLAVCAKRLYFIESGFAVPLAPEPSTEGMMAAASAANAATGITATSTLLALGGIGIFVALFVIARALAPTGTDQTTTKENA